MHVNSHFDTRPEDILDDLHTGNGMRGSTTLHVTRDLDTVPTRLRRALAGVVGDATAHGQLIAEPMAVVAGPARRRAAEGVWEGSIVIDGDRFATVDDHHLEPLNVAKKNAPELRALLQLRDQVKSTR
ncbi:hypothetical protein [Microbacterium sp. SSM24]|uniref:hypothetical protein n=1 Tax=Microbacterium sp. SSM24 TaxID=2991714 RepID=UPI002226A2AA|nr:hypothetical protein [Microbacterium sp. SSM24]MCW3492173.1 hypothetical protein [Microbacterium sp. SSM24]